MSKPQINSGKEHAVAVYRVSTKKQLQGEGIEIQRTDTRHDAKVRGQIIVKEFVIAETASEIEDRVEYTDALEWIIRNKKQIDVMKIWKVDRFCRGGLADYYSLKESLKKHGIRLESATEKIDDTASGEAMEGFLAVFARLENRIKTDRTIGAEKNMVAKGWWCRPAPTGFKNVHVPAGKDGAGKTIFRPNLAPTDDKKQWELLCYGLRRQLTGIKPAILARKLADKGLLMREITRNGATKQNPVSPQSWTKMCRSPVYGGMNQELWTGNKLIEAQWDGPLTPDEWHLLQRVMNKGKEKQLVQRRHKLNDAVPLRRFLLCPACGKPTRGYGSVGKSKKKKHYYYDCENTECGFRTKPKEAHDLFLEFLETIRPTEDLLELFRAIVLDVWEHEFTELSRASIEASDAVSRARAERIEILETMKQSRKNPDLYSLLEQQFNEKTVEIQQATAQRKDSELKEYKAEEVLRYCIHYLKHANELWNKADVEDQNRLQRLALPDGIHYDVFEDKRTPRLSVVYEAIKDVGNAKSDMAAPRRIELRLQE